MSYPIQFEEVLHWFYVKDAHCHIFEMPSFDKSNIIRTDQEWGVDLHWTVCGQLPYIMCGKWVCKMYLEEMGKSEFGFPNGIGEVVIPFRQHSPHTYRARIRIPAHTVPPGIYKLVVSVLFYGPTNAPGPITGFVEGPLLNFYHGGRIPLHGHHGHPGHHDHHRGGHFIHEAESDASLETGDTMMAESETVEFVETAGESNDAFEPPASAAARPARYRKK